VSDRTIIMLNAACMYMKCVCLGDINDILIVFP